MSGHLRGGISIKLLLVNEVEFAGREQVQELVQETDSPAVRAASVLESRVGGACGARVAVRIRVTVKINDNEEAKWQW